jgi:hypothetical protein
LKKISLGLFSALFALMLVAPALAAAPTHNVTGGGWFISVETENPSSVIGHECHFGVQVKEKDGVWTGTGSFMDKDSRIKAILTITSGAQTDPTRYEVYGKARVYLDNKFTDEVDFTMVLRIDPQRFRIWWNGYEASAAYSDEPDAIHDNIVFH